MSNKVVKEINDLPLTNAIKFSAGQIEKWSGRVEFHMYGTTVWGECYGNLVSHTAQASKVHIQNYEHGPHFSKCHQNNLKEMGKCTTRISPQELII